MRLLDQLESRLGRFAIPGLIQLIATLQLITLVVFMFLPVESRQPYEEFLLLKPDAILRGEIWRLFSYVIIPSSSVFIAVIAAMFMMWLGKGLDEAWGAFRVNAYVLGGMMALAAGALIFGFEASAMWMHLSVLFAFACIYPNEEILLFFILPLKIKWVAIFTAAMLALSVLSSPFALVPVCFALLNFFATFGPGFIRGRMQAVRTAERRARFDAGTEAAFFHQCKVCGKTEADDPALHFRVTDDGDEICSACRK
jgi:hypothetical protein